jgi:hypothetical protein
MTLSYSAMTREAYPTALIRLSHHGEPEAVQSVTGEDQ